ncbi:nitric oxide synthase [Xylariales sp. PMI_506]|nr:nitric oxide synthase [Xylariales sp. PMI_506]
MELQSCPFLESGNGYHCRGGVLGHAAGNLPESEFAQIQKSYPVLASTGCTSQLCQSGRMKHTDEERVGRNQPIEVVERDAVDFLYQLKQAGFIASEQALNKRIRKVIEEIRATSTYARYTSYRGSGSDMKQRGSVGVIGGTWSQTFEELQAGIRLAWKHSRKCIMRSEYKDLKLHDLRNVKSSVEMGKELVSALKLAFNGGEIRPTVFMFPPRGPNERGPMVWNNNLLSFAGYTCDDGTILGDPLNVNLTQAIMDLGWEPPTTRTRWDLLPIVTMAQGDVPAITDLSQDLFPLVPIQHPGHKLAFEKLGLRWVPAPVLSRLGFTIGGVQYTASPFIGWFMDAEIGVRNLVDPFRYNVLPQVVKMMGLFDGELDHLPDFERLALISRAQVELNYAASWSFAKAKVRMIDSLSASELFSRFDDDHLAEHGYRVPSDPYWIAPPQGSIIPLWHRGAAPNYQPKPMICHHVQDPIKAWRRERGDGDKSMGSRDGELPKLVPSSHSTPATTQRRIIVSFCSSGTVAGKLCKKIHGLLLEASHINPNFGNIVPIQTLNATTKIKLGHDDTLIIVASNTRRGEMPQNGSEFLEALQTGNTSVPARFAIFGNGSKDYPDTFNQTAIVLENLLEKGGAASLVSPVHADTTMENPPWTSFSLFCRQALQALHGAPPTPDSEPTIIHFDPKPIQLHADTTTWFQAKLTKIVRDTTCKSMKRVSLDIGNRCYPLMAYLSVLPPNPLTEVRALLTAIDMDASELLPSIAGTVTAEELFRFYADLQAPFRNVRWASRTAAELDLGEMATLPFPKALAALPTNWRSLVSVKEMCRAVPVIQTRKYSVASDYQYSPAVADTPAGSPVELELLVKHHDGGRFSEHLLGSLEPGQGSELVCRIEPASHLERFASATNRPLILFCTGSGAAPIRALLQHRVYLWRRQQQQQQPGAGEPPCGEVPAKITILAGCRAEDEELVREAIAEAAALGLLDFVRIVGGGTLRAALTRKLVRQRGLVLACARPEAERDFCANLGALLGVPDVREALGDRYVADIYQAAV